MIKAFIQIRIKQVYRSLEEIGLFRTIFVTGIIGFLAFGLFGQTAETPNVFITAGAYVMMITLIHLKRRDLQFLRIHFPNFKRVILTEYLLLTVPLFWGLIYNAQWLTLICAFVSTSLIVHIELIPKKISFNTVLQVWIPSGSFEWKGGVRQTFIFTITVWILGLLTSFFIGSVPVVLFILGIVTMNFYEKGEPLQMLLAYELSTNRFLWHKIKTQSFLFTILTLPLIIAFLFFHPDKWYIPLAEYLIFMNVHLYIILTKYAFYQPNNKSTGSQAFGVIGALGIIIPVFIPLVWLLSIRFYFKSRENLNFYLNDYN